MRIDCSKTLNYVAEKIRLCNSYKKNDSWCAYCPMAELECDIVEEITQKHINIVQKWSDEHPQETMAEHFFEMCPNAPKYENGDPQCCPYHLGWDDTDDCPNNGPGEGVTCTECWNRPYREAADNSKG